MSDSPTLTGKVVHVSETQTFGNDFQKRFIVLEVGYGDNGKSNQHGFQVFKDKLGLLDGYQIGDEATVSYNLGTCREYNGKWYADMHNAWRISKVGGNSNTAPKQSEPVQDDAFDDGDDPF